MAQGSVVFLNKVERDGIAETAETRPRIAKVNFMSNMGDNDFFHELLYFSIITVPFIIYPRALRDLRRCLFRRLLQRAQGFPQGL